MKVFHTCLINGIPDEHTADLKPTSTDRVMCCTRYRGQRCDGSRIEWFSGCDIHGNPEAVD